VNATEPILEEPLQVIGGPIPTTSILGQPLGSNIKHILEDLNFELKDSIGMKGDNMEPATVEGEKAQLKPLSSILEVGTSSKAPTPKRPQSLTLTRVKHLRLSTLRLLSLRVPLK
jgi:hypothetical protein